MKNKKTLVILLIIPFIIGLISFVSVIVLQNTVAQDISGIIWDYDEVEGFKIDENNGYELKAEPVVPENVIIANGNELTWSLSNVDKSSNEYAKIEQVEDKFTLYALSEGEVTITCSNIRGTVSKHFTAIIYDTGLITITAENTQSGYQLENTRYFGQYDITYDSLDSEIQKHNAVIPIKIKGIYEGIEISDFALKAKSDNVVYNSVDQTITVNSGGPSYITITSNTHNYLEYTYRFNAVSDGYNVYSYNDLMKLTNKADESYNVVMQVNLESKENTFNKKGGEYDFNSYKSSNTKLFGNLNDKYGKTSFDKEVVYVETKYNHDYIDQLSKSKGKQYNKNICVGIDLKGDLYGNGFTINGHELCYPNNGSYATDGKLTPGPGDLFTGPLAYVTIGDIDAPIVKAFGEDNALLYVHKEGITINDIQLKNVNNNDNVYNFTYVGSTINVQEKNVTIKNSILSNAKNVVYAFSSENLLIDNCVLQNSCQFLLECGANEEVEVDDNLNVDLQYGDYRINGTLKEVTQPNTALDTIIGRFVMSNDITDEDKQMLYKGLNELQDYFNTNPYSAADAYNYTVNNVKFANSGLFSISLNSAFNGTYLYNGTPSTINSVLSAFLKVDLPDNIGGISKPVNVNIKGKTQFYDWKTIDSVDASCLLYDQINEFIDIYAPDRDIHLEIDDFFPMKAILDELTKNGIQYSYQGKRYINTPIAYYGGGLNMSTINTSEIVDNIFGEELLVDLFDRVLTNKISGGTAVSVLSKCVMIAVGFKPFRFITNKTGDTTNFGETYSREEMKENANS